jgi:tetratricopeptide (TPR) repeat protein
MRSASFLNTFTIRFVAGALCLVLAGPVVAQDNERKTKQTVAMSQSVFEKLTEIQALVELEDYAGGHALIRELQAKDKLSPYEKAQLYNLAGYAYYLEEKYDDAIRSYEQVLQQPDLPEALQTSSLKTMAQLQFTIEDYETALLTVRRLMALVPEPSSDIYMLLGQAYFQMQQYQEALDPISTAVNMTIAQGRTPRENDLLLLRVCHYELNDFPKMIDVLIQLITHYPKDTYVLTLAGVYSELGDTKKQLALAEVLYEKGLLSNSTHVVNLANLYLLHEIPFKAAKILETGMDNEVVAKEVRNLRLLSQAWYSAREDEKAIPPLQQAADISQEGELFVRLAQAHLNLENWDSAAKAIEKGLELGGLSREDTAHIMLGMSYFNQQKFSPARRAFQAALPDRRSTRTAQQWVRYVDSEIRRLEVMKQTLPVNEGRKVDELENMLNAGKQ